MLLLIGRSTSKRRLFLVPVLLLVPCVAAVRGQPPRGEDPPDRIDPDRDAVEERGRDGSLPPRRSPKRFDMRPQFRREADGYHFVVPAFEEARREAVDQAYREGFEEGRRLEREDVQIERGGNAYQDAMADGNAAFSAGDYSLAARQFLLAATLNQGDPAARLCAAHTHIALGDYKPAVPLILRALELQPKIIYLPLDIRGAYGDRGTFDRHLRALEDAADDDAENVELAFLVGYCRFFSSDMPGAVEPLDRAARAMPRERAVVRMAELARTVAGRAGPKSTERR